MQFKKLGLIFKPDPSFSWMSSHSQLPTPFLLNDEGQCRVFFAGRSSDQVSSIGYFDINLNDPKKLINFSKEPVLIHGDIGHFDQFGVFPSSVIKKDDQYWLYYIGWVKGATPPLFYASIGLARSYDCNSFEKYSNVPIMSTSKHDPCLVTSPHVYFENDTYHMAYVSGDKWTKNGEILQSHYNIKYAHSKDALNWEREGRKLIDYNSDEETNIARAAIFKNDSNKYSMFYSYVKNKQGYQIGYATSGDGLSWNRFDEKLTIVSEEQSISFDDKMQCYPAVIKYKKTYFLFYNGNNYGYDGVHLAVSNENNV